MAGTVYILDKTGICKLKTELHIHSTVHAELVNDILTQAPSNNAIIIIKLIPKNY